MIGAVGTLLGERGVNIAQMVGRGTDDHAVMVLTTDAVIPPAVLEEIVALDGFLDGHAVSLG